MTDSSESPEYPEKIEDGIVVMDFPAVNASLNALATILLVVGFVLIKQKKK